MNDTDKGGMTVSSLLLTSLIVSLALPEIALLILGVLKGSADPTFTYVVVGAALVVLVGVLGVNYFVRRNIQNRLLSLVDACRNFAGGVSSSNGCRTFSKAMGFARAQPIRAAHIPWFQKVRFVSMPDRRLQPAFEMCY